jgi:hypothetical protein
MIIATSKVCEIGGIDEITIVSFRDFRLIKSLLRIVRYLREATFEEWVEFCKIDCGEVPEWCTKEGLKGYKFYEIEERRE